VFESRQVKVGDSGRLYRVPAGITESVLAWDVNGRLAKYGRVEPLRARFFETCVGIAVDVGPVAEGLVDATRIDGIDREWDSCLIGNDAIDLPTADGEVGGSAGRPQKALAAPNRYFVYQTGHEPMSGVVA